MIAALKGILAYKSPSHVVVDVHGVGYRVVIPLSAYVRLPEADKPISLHVHTHVREDAIQLYGFLSLEERDLFILLIGISGIGPKFAIAILSGLPAPELIEVVVRGDETRLAMVPGIGKKTAARIILELREKLSGVASRGLSGLDASQGPNIRDDVLSALINLGYPRNRAQEVVDRIRQSQNDVSLESLLKASLKALSQG